MRVLITGASGFVGKILVNKLLKLGIKILAISRKNLDKSYTQKINWIKADLSNKASYQNQVSQFAPEVVIHLAWQDIPDFSPEKCNINLDQSLQFVQFVSSIKCCKKILFSGSCLEYDNLVGECIETKKIEIFKNYFSFAKNSLLKKTQIICKKNSIIFGWFRIFYVYGPGQRPNSLLPSILTYLKMSKLPIITSPFNSNDYIYIDDVANAFVKATINNFPSGIFNLGSGYSTSVVQICRYAEKIVLNSSILSGELEANSKYKRSDVNFWACNKKALKFLNWQPEISLIDGINKTWNSLK